MFSSKTLDQIWIFNYMGQIHWDNSYQTSFVCFDTRRDKSTRAQKDPKRHLNWMQSHVPLLQMVEKCWDAMKPDQVSCWETSSRYAIGIMCLLWASRLLLLSHALFGTLWHSLELFGMREPMMQHQWCALTMNHLPTPLQHLIAHCLDGSIHDLIQVHGFCPERLWGAGFGGVAKRRSWLAPQRRKMKQGPCNMIRHYKR